MTTFFPMSLWYAISILPAVYLVKTYPKDGEKEPFAAFLAPSLVFVVLVLLLSWVAHQWPIFGAINRILFFLAIWLIFQTYSVIETFAIYLVWHLVFMGGLYMFGIFGAG